MKKHRKLKTLIAVGLTLMMTAAIPITAYAAENEAYVYKYTKSEDFSNNDVIYANGSGSTPAYLRYVTGPDGNQQQYGGYCADFESEVVMGSYYSRTNISEASYYATSVKGHLRAILANSVPVKSLDVLKSAANIPSLDYGEAVAATQWAIWAYTNPSSPEIAIPTADGTSDKEKAAYYLYNLPPINGAYATEPIQMSIEAYQDGSKMIFDYGGSINISALYNKNITATDSSGNTLEYTDEDFKVIVDVSGLTESQTVSVDIEGQQTLAADAYLYNPKGGRMASQSLISWFVGESLVAGSANGNYDVEKEVADLTFEAVKELDGRDIDTSVDNFIFIVEDKETGEEAARGTADNDGNVVFSEIEYNKTQVGQTFNYIMYEEKGSNPGMTYDDSIKEIAVTVGYEDGEVVLDVIYSEDTDMTFTNYYVAEDAKAQLEVDKKMIGKKQLAENMFQFTKIECDENGTPLEGAEPVTVSNNADGSVIFDEMIFDDESVHYYLIKENNGGKKIDGIIYDDREMIVKVTITDNKLGKLIAAVEYPEDAVFYNEWKPDPVMVDLEGSKELEGRQMKDGEFTFVLKNEAGEIVDEVLNDKKGNFVFGEIVFDDEGEYRFEVSEVAGDLPGIRYDETVFEVVVTVTDDLSGKLKAEISYPEMGIVFENIYEGGKLEVTKVVTMEGELFPNEAIFHAALFMDKELTMMTLHGIQPIYMNGNAESTIVFENLEYGKTYYVAETDSFGRPIRSGDFGIAQVTLINNVIVVENQNEIPEALIINEYEDQTQLVDDEDGNKDEDEDKNKEEKNDKNKKDEAVKTNDAFNLKMFAGLLIISAAGLLGALVIRRREF